MMKKKNDKRNKIIIVLFLMALYLPSISFMFIRNFLSPDDSENRRLADFPTVTKISDLKNYPSRINNWYNDNMPYRNLARQVYSEINYRVFNNAVASGVIIGKDDGDWRHRWLFLNNPNANDAIGDVRGTKHFNDSDKKEILDDIKYNTEKMKKAGRKLVYMVPANKSTAYREMLPESINIINETSLMEDLTSYLEENDISNFIFLDKAIAEEKTKAKYPLYYLRDTHWNQYGAFIGTKAMMGKIEPSFNAFDDYEVTSEGYTITGTSVEVSDGYTINTGDLKKQLNLKTGIADQKIIVKTKYNKDPEVKNIAEDEKKGNIFVTDIDNPIYNKTVLLIGDSYRDAMTPWLGKIFKKAILMHIDAYDEHTIEKFNPDIVIIETLERRSEALKFKL
jgi:hypothetical protein